MDTNTDANHDQAIATWKKNERGPVRAYKGSRSGGKQNRKGAPLCLCCYPVAVSGQHVPLRYGVTIALCDDHRDPAFVISRGGRDFLAAVASMFTSLGLRSARYGKALLAFVEDVRNMQTPTPRARPGSYAWPHLRTAAEATWAARGTYHDGEKVVLDALRPHIDAVKPPSRHTIRRWWRERRWLTPRPAPAPKTAEAPLVDQRVIHHVERRERHPDLVGKELRGPGTPPDPESGERS